MRTWSSMSRLDMLILTLAWSGNVIIAGALIAFPFFAWGAFGFSGTFLFSCGLLLFVALVVILGV